VIAYQHCQVEADQQPDLWAVRLRNLEARARYLELAVAALLGRVPEAHRAAQLLSELADLQKGQETPSPHIARAPTAKHAGL
jgi:hypothetical protein